jgi:ribosome-associated translation inhibitor RaiA
MEVSILARGVGVDEPLREQIQRRFEFALGRFRRRVARVAVTLEDLNGPRGGRDKFCRIVARLRPSGSLVIGQADPDVLTAVDRAAQSLSYRIGRLLDRRRTSRP